MFLKPLEQSEQVIVGNVVEVNSVLAHDESTDEADISSIKQSSTQMVVTQSSINTNPENVETLIYSASGEHLNSEVKIGQPVLSYMGTTESEITETETTEEGEQTTDATTAVSEVEVEEEVSATPELAEQLEQNGLETEIVTQDEFTTFIADEKVEVAQE